MTADETLAEYVVVPAEGFRVAIQRVSREATALIALARTRGVDIRVESEYVPDAIYDEEYYPLGRTLIEEISR